MSRTKTVHASKEKTKYHLFVLLDTLELTNHLQSC